MAKISKIECYLLLFTTLYFSLPKREDMEQYIDICTGSLLTILTHLGPIHHHQRRNNPYPV